jgi:hypothetical protein
MLRRFFLAAAMAASAAPAIAQIRLTEDEPDPSLIEPANALEYAFVSALTNARMRPVFRRYLVSTHVVLALTSADPESEPLEVDVRPDFRAGALFTSIQRIDAVLGADAPRIVINGRAALERLRGKNVVINYQLAPMLTLEPADVASYLETPGESSAGPSQ